MILIAAALLCLVLAAGYTVFIQPLLQKDKWIYKEAVVERGTLTAGVTESGSLEYGITDLPYDLDLTVEEDEEDGEDSEEDEEDEEAAQKYLKVEEVFVAKGQKITRGDSVMKFTQDSVDAVRRLLSSAQTDAQVAFSEAESAYNLSVLKAKLELESDTVTTKYANSIYKYANKAIGDTLSADKLELERLTGLTDSLKKKYEEALEDLAEAQEDYKEAQEALESAGDNEHVYIPLQSASLSAGNKYRQALTKAEQAKQSIENTDKEIISLREQIRLAEAKSTIDRLEADKNRESGLLTEEIAQTEYTASLESLKEELTEAQEELTKITGQVEAFEAFVGQEGIVYADGTGVVTQVGYGAGESLYMAGNVISYAKTEDMTIVVDVTQEDIINLKVGDKAEIVFKASDGKVYQGIVTSIVTTNTSENSATVSYPVTIAVQGDTSGLYGGMSADVTFVTEAREDVLYVSKKAILEQNGKTYVYVDNAFGSKVLKEVKTGLGNGVNIEITEGLEEGDTVYIASKVSSEADVTNTDTDESDAGQGGEIVTEGGLSFGTEAGDGMEGAYEIEGRDGGMNMIPGVTMGGTP